MGGNSLTILSAGTFVRGDVYSEDTLVIEGGIEGNVAANRVIVKPKGWVHGDLNCSSLSIEPGGVVDGEVKVAQAPALPPGRAQAEALTHDPAALVQLAGSQTEPDPEQANPAKTSL